jgi:dTMP kinase
MGAKTKHIPDGFVIIFEGVDGVGKTTQLRLAQETLEKEGFEVHATRNLGGTPIGEALRDVAFSSHHRTPETDLYISAAIQAELAESIKNERAKGRVVLVDRGPLSFAAYHVYGNGVEAALGWEFADQGITRFKPDLVILYEMELGAALDRAKRRKSQVDYYASKPKSYFENVEKGYKAAAKRYPKVITIDASKDVDTVHDLTMRKISKALPQEARS